MKRESHRSLRFDLIFDLSLLTLCALLLSEGLLIVMLRIKGPEGFENLAKSYLSALHESFVSDLGSKNVKKSSSTEWVALFEEFRKAHAANEGLANVNFDFLTEAVAGPALESRERNFLFFIPSIYEYRYSREVPGAGTFRYQWSLEPYQQLVTEFKYQTFFLTLLIEIFLVILGYYLLFRRNVLIPIGELSRVSRAFLNEDFGARANVERRDELGKVGEALNEMAAKIQDKEKKLVLTIESLKRANEEIELAQNEQLQIEKLASIGRLAAGVAHEVGNPLGAISGYIDILRRSMQKLPESNKEDIELCDRIETETNRISKIIRALLNQARPSKERIRAVKIKPVLVRSVQLAQIPADIDLSYDFEDEEAEVMGEGDQLVQVFLNLLVNAKHAIETRAEKSEPGRLKIRCASRRLPVYRGGDSTNEYDTSVVRALKPETYWVISVEDNGIGIKAEDQKKLFEPFFSTKAPGKGTGLGLYVTKSIVESFRGAIVLRSAFGYGTAFSVFLPKGRSSASIAL